jgi:hypothetical protein
MNNKICLKCNQPNQPEMSFCMNCGAELSHGSADDMPATVMAGNFGAFPQQSGQNFEQQPNFQPQQQPQFQQPNFQTPQFQTAPTQSGGGMKKILLGVGGILIGFIMLASGGVKLYRAFGGSSSPSSTPYLLANTNSGTSNTGNVKPSNTNSASSFRTMSDMTQQTEKDGFSGATEEKQFKYYDSSGAMVHLTIANYPSAYEAEKGLRTSMQKFKTLKLKVGEETVAGDNDGNEIGITNTMASANGKIFTRYWTNKNFLLRALGTEADVENFFKKSER